MEWISVKERLPKPGQEVLLWATGAPLQKTYSRYDMGVYNPDIYQPWWDYVTHWMPLPEPPKESPVN